KPILHGLCTYGFGVQAILKMWCDYDNTKMKSVTARFTAPVYPGETFIVESWKSPDGAGVSFRTWVKERKVKVLDNGYAEITFL
ncbi:MAG: MaoC/PaaZ C-terminal domain-containing protein, partial [Desulfobulbaceae bacterium]|nr:MaoC/PaaZ C-terminal domain-containing protein [Desulfobulbaceae bacterium]